jgi:hypothetical protein
MGYDPSEEKSSRYYTVGFNLTSSIEVGAYSSALNSGLTNSDCSNAMPPLEGYAFFSAGKRVASLPSNINHLALANIGLGDQSEDSKQIFTAGAAGVVHKKFTSNTQSSYMTIDQFKVISNNSKRFLVTFFSI